MAQTPSPTQAPVTDEAFLADRLAFWSGFCNATVISAGVIVLLLAGMAIFLV